MLHVPAQDTEMTSLESLQPRILLEGNKEAALTQPLTASVTFFRLFFSRLFVPSRVVCKLLLSFVLRCCLSDAPFLSTCLTKHLLMENCDL